MKARANLLIYLGLAVLPLISYLQHFSPYEVPKTWVISVLAILSVGVKMVDNKKTEGDRRVLTLIVMLIIWLVVASWWGGSWWQSWWGNPYRADGLLTLLSMVVLGLMLEVREKLFAWVGVGSIVLASMVIVRGEPVTPLTMGNINNLAGYLALTLPAVWQSREIRWLVILPLIAISMLGSWGGILTAVVWILIQILWHHKTTLVVMLVGMGVLVGGLYLQEYQSNLVPGMVVAEERGRIITKALLATGQKPILGWGWSRFSEAFSQIDYPYHFEIDAYVDRTHSSILEYGVAGGLPALFIYLLLIWMVATRLKGGSQVDRTLLMMLGLYLVQSQTNVTSVVQDYWLWMAVGRVASQSLDR